MSYALKLPDDYKIIPETEFLLKKQNEYSKLSNAKTGSQALPGQGGCYPGFCQKEQDQL